MAGLASAGHESIGSATDDRSTLAAAALLHFHRRLRLGEPRHLRGDRQRRERGHAENLRSSIGLTMIGSYLVQILTRDVAGSRIERVDERREPLHVARVSRETSTNVRSADDQMAHSWPSISTSSSGASVRGSMNNDTGWPLCRYMMCATLPSPYRHGRDPTSSRPSRSEPSGSRMFQPKPEAIDALDGLGRLVRAEHGVHREALHVIGGELGGHDAR